MAKKSAPKKAAGKPRASASAGAKSKASSSAKAPLETVAEAKEKTLKPAAGPTKLADPKGTETLAAKGATLLTKAATAVKKKVSKKATAKKVSAEILPNEDAEFESGLTTDAGSDSGGEENSNSRSLAVADPVALYLQEIRKYPLLTREQELELATRYFETKDPAAAQALVTANLRFVVKVAADYSKFGARMIDLVQEGNMGLMHAVRDFNPHKGVRLITYAVWWIRGYIQEYLLKQYSMVKIATTLNQKKLFYRLQKEKEALDRMGIAPDMALIGTRMGIPTEEVEQMNQRLSGRDVSLNAPLDDSAGAQLIDVQKSSDMGVDDEIGHNEELAVLKAQLEELRPELSDREKIILEERLLADEPLTLQEIGEKYGITREAVRQMEARLMKKIKDRVREQL